VGLDKEIREGIQVAKREIHRRTVSNTKFRQKMRMEVNVSDYVMGEILSMEYEDGK